MAEIKIRKYRRRDRKAILRITEESFEGFCLDSNMDEHFGGVAGTTWQERKRSGIDYDLRRNPQHAFVAEVNGEVAGFVCTRTYPDYLIGHVANMAVAPERQGQGVGKKLIEAALDHFRQWGMRYARIETLEQNFKATRLYPSFGFEEIGRQVFYMRRLAP